MPRRSIQSAVRGLRILPSCRLKRTKLCHNGLLLGSPPLAERILPFFSIPGNWTASCAHPWARNCSPWFNPVIEQHNWRRRVRYEPPMLCDASVNCFCRIACSPAFLLFLPRLKTNPFAFCSPAWAVFPNSPTSSEVTFRHTCISRLAHQRAPQTMTQ